MRYVLGAGCLVAGLALAACGDGEAPSPPALDDVPEVTADDPLALSGTAEPGALVQARGGASIGETTAGSDGAFTVEVPLRPDEANILLVSQVVGGLESAPVTVQVTHDGTPPTVPTVEEPATPTRIAIQVIRGAAEAGATIEIEGAAAPAMGAVDADGRFAVEIELERSDTMTVDNALRVVAIDPAGNRSPAAEATIVFDPTLPLEAPRFDDPPAFTNQGTLTLAGVAEPRVGITVAGGATDGSATAGADGRFSVDVGLRPNAANTLLAFAVDADDTSPSVTLRVTHDDMAPDAPELDAQASPTGAETIRLTGLTEPHATIEVTGGAAPSMGTADDEGALSVDVALTVDATNELSVVAADRAGNRSAAVALTVVQDSSLEAPIVVDPVASPTAASSVTLTGTAPASAMIEITGGAATVTTMSDVGGAWMADVELRPNARNELAVSRPGSGVQTLITVTHDDVAPDAPTLNPLASPTRHTTVEVTGTTEARARVSVTGATAPAASTAMVDGRFSVTVVIAEDTETSLTVIATDRAGNSGAPAVATVTHSSTTPPAPTVDDPNPAPTNMATYTLTGRAASPGAGITAVVRGGAADAMGPTDPGTGAFSLMVSLAPNASNELRVVTREGTIDSAEAVVTVVHDDIAPAAPVASALTANSGTCAVGIPVSGNVAGAAGSVEGRARVTVENVTRSTMATTSATDMGSFNASLASCPGDVIRVIAVDAATNASPATEINAS